MSMDVCMQRDMVVPSIGVDVVVPGYCSWVVGLITWRRCVRFFGKRVSCVFGDFGAGVPRSHGSKLGSLSKGYVIGNGTYIALAF